jgi:Tol biopolymer transport system component
MPLSPGSRLGVYDVIARIGAGGMGEVYRARDTMLARDVAIKVLPDFALSDHERVARFEREARTLATLSHPNIGVIHGFEEIAAAGPDQAPVRALILELIEGDTLADRLLHGPLPFDDALDIAGQIADALAAAHEKGIVHRDLKPANVKITPGGVVKVLDFGLAKIAADASTAGSTVTIAATGSHVILGTPAYMAPEQAQGRPVDTRADIWALGVLLYEMLAGEQPFRGASVQDTLAAVLTADPDWNRIPPTVRPILRRCLERDPRRRLRDVGDFRFLFDLASSADVPAARPSWLRPPAPASLGFAVVIIAVVAWGWFRPRAEAPAEPVRMLTMLPPGVSVTRGPGAGSSVAVSPDGRTIVIAGTGKDGQRLYTRPLDRLEATPLAGTDRGSSPFFSWDGAWIGFFADGRLKRVPAAGGAAVDIAAAPGFPAGASWGSDDRIVYASGAYSQLHTVDARGGNAEPVAAVKLGYNPEVLNDGKTLLFESDGWIHVIDRASGRQTRLVEGSAPRYAIGHLILSRGTALLAASVDLASQKVTGPVVPLLEGVAFEAGAESRPRHYAISLNGTLAYLPAANAYALVLVHPDGTERVITEGQPLIENPQFSPDGKRVVVAITRRDGEPADLWIHDVGTSGPGTRITFDGGRAPVWTPGSASVTYSHLGDRGGIYEKRADGGGNAAQLVALDAFHWLVGWTSDRRALAYGLMEGTLSSVMVHRDNLSRRIVGPGQTWGGRLSGDDRWLAYYSLESGNFEVYVTPFPEVDTRWLIAEGTDPTWGPPDTELYYRRGARLMAARLDTSAGIRVLSHRLVIEPFLPPLYDDYDIHPDGRTLVMVRPAGSTQTREVTMVLDWFTELRRAMGGS